MLLKLAPVLAPQQAMVASRPWLPAGKLLHAFPSAFGHGAAHDGGFVAAHGLQQVKVCKCTNKAHIEQGACT